MANIFDPFGLAARAIDFAKLGFRVASWTEDQLWTQVRNQLDARAPESHASAPAPASTVPATASLNAKMRQLLDRALDQSTRSSQLELFAHIVDQLVADEARIIGALSDGSASPLVNVHAWNRPGVSGRAVLENASLIGRTANIALPAMVPTYIGHLLSLGLVETGPEDPVLKDDYEVLTAELMVLQAIKSASLGPLPGKVDKLTVRLSSLGQALWAATMQQDTP